MTDLPNGFRIIRGIVIEGTGQGDEIFGPILQRWETWTERRFFRHAEHRCGWRTIERSTPFSGDAEAVQALTRTAHMLHTPKETA